MLAQVHGLWDFFILSQPTGGLWLRKDQRTLATHRQCGPLWVVGGRVEREHIYML